MKIFGICLIKNEEDIIAHSLQHHTSWADYVFVYDNGSTDRTWEIVQEEAQKNPKIVPFKSEARPFRDGLRAEVFNAYKHLAEEGDWWCIGCDPDEFYIDDPRTFLPAIKAKYHVVTTIHFEYRLTVEDISKLDFNVDIARQLKQLKYYHKKQTSEIRFVKHRKRLTWPEEGYGIFKHKGILSPDKIKVKHYQYRTPQQIKNRIRIRTEAYQQGCQFFKRDAVDSWKEKLVPREECIYDNGKWEMGYLRDMNNLPLWKTMLLRFLHGTGIFP